MRKRDDQKGNGEEKWIKENRTEEKLKGKKRGDGMRNRENQEGKGGER